MHHLATLFSKADSFAHYACLYQERLDAVLGSLDMKLLGQVAMTLMDARDNGNTLYVIGNGGSAATAAHFVNDLVAGAYMPEGPNFRACSLSENVALVTALANDSGYDHIFLRQLEVLLEPGDIVMALSVSGNSPNILSALEYAAEQGNITIGLCGFGGGAMAAKCHMAIHAETTPDEYGPVEDIFSIVLHILSGYMAMKSGKRLHH